MEPLFISQWTHDNHSLYELVPIFRKHPSRILLITMPMVIIIVIFFLALWGIFGFQDYTWLIPLPAACFYFIYVFIDPYLRTIHLKIKMILKKFLFIMIRFKFKYTTITKLLYPLPMHIHLLPLSQQLLLFIVLI